MRVNIWLPDYLAVQARQEDMNVSAVCRRAIEEELNKAKEAKKAWRAR